MSDPVITPIAIVPGDQADAQVLLVEGDLLAVRLVGVAHQPIVPVAIGALHILPGYEHAWRAAIARELHPGDRVTLVWIGAQSGGLMEASIWHHGLAVDQAAIQEGWALPTSAALGIPAVAAPYRKALTTAARQEAGGFADRAQTAWLRSQVTTLLGANGRSLAPTYFAANPGFCVALVLLLGVVVMLAMRRDNLGVVTRNAQGGSGLTKALRWAIDLHLRFVRPSTIRPEQPAKGDQP